MSELTATAPADVSQHWTIELAESGLLPDVILRAAMRRLLRERLREERVDDPEAEQERHERFLARMAVSPIAVETQAANRQHYEVPAAFYRIALGARLKYSSCLYRSGAESLDQAEEAMLALTCERAELADGMDILEIGCGWGSLTLWMAEKFPRARILGVSNSHSQRAHILEQARLRGLGNVEIHTADISGYAPPRHYDRVVSVECFEHLRNHGELFRRIAGWLKSDGKLFCHVFTHRSCSYAFDDQGAGDWMARHFFTGGIMPSDHLFLHYQDDLAIDRHWRVSGQHYARTARHWLENLDRRRHEVLAVFAQGMDGREARRMVQRWRMFFMACEELWAFRGGREWLVSHYLMRPRGHRAG